MENRNRLFDDLSRLADGAASAVAGIKGDIGALVRQQLERMLADMDVVPRDEFDAVKAVAAKAREEQEKLEKRVADLEAKLAAKPRSTTAKRSQAKSRGSSKDGAS